MNNTPSKKIALPIGTPEVEITKIKHEGYDVVEFYDPESLQRQE